MKTKLKKMINSEIAASFSEKLMEIQMKVFSYDNASGNIFFLKNFHAEFKSRLKIEKFLVLL